MQTIETYTPEHLKLWTMPPSYCGAVWPAYYSSGFGQSRESDALERSNFECVVAALKAISPESEDVWQIVRESHWAVGWVEWIAIHQDATEHLRVADKIREHYENYPVVNEEHFSQVETDDANETWKNCYRPKERLEWIRRHRSQFEFHDFADMLNCVRGKYFAGYASELLN